jgi:hypothetical protein
MHLLILEKRENFTSGQSEKSGNSHLVTDKEIKFHQKKVIQR